MGFHGWGGCIQVGKVAFKPCIVGFEETHEVVMQMGVRAVLKRLIG